MFKRTALSFALVVTAAHAAAATDYYVVVPVGGRMALSEPISVGLSGLPLPAGMVGQAYPSFDFKSLLTVTGDPTYSGYGLTWKVVDGQLPAGLTLSSSGVLSGVPTASGTASFQLQASYKTKTGQSAYQVVVAAITVGLASGTPPVAPVGVAYSYDLKPLLLVEGDAGYNGSGVTWSVVASTLPAGLSLLADGTIAGTPTAAGNGSVTARASYKGVNGQQTYQVATLNIGVSLAAMPEGNFPVGWPFSFDFKQLLSVSGDSAYTGAGVTWRIESGALPPGVTLGADGTISGTPSAAGTHSFTIRASYKGVNGQQTYKMGAYNL